MSQRVTGGRGAGPQLDTLTEGNPRARESFVSRQTIAVGRQT
jgi:hypothetical protein